MTTKKKLLLTTKKIGSCRESPLRPYYEPPLLIVNWIEIKITVELLIIETIIRRMLAERVGLHCALCCGS